MTSSLNAILVSVDCTDLLSLTLPYNRHHFNRVLVVTSCEDAGPVHDVTEKHNAETFYTNAFYARGADFNKWAALEEALDAKKYRKGWLCVMDVDVLWPREAKLDGFMEKGRLTSPLRRMMEDITPLRLHGEKGIPPEKEWCNYRIHPNVSEWAGYSQIFHADDPHLPKPPWHETNWKHAGGADSFFQLLWPAVCKIRPPWQCLHLGPAGTNWCGRASQYLHGGSHPQATQRYNRLRGYLRGRKPGVGRFDHEKLI